MRSCSDSSSETSTEIVPTSTGWPFSWRSAISCATAAHLPSMVLKIWSFWSLRIIVPVGRDLDHRQLVDLHELVGLGEGGARHAGQLVVHAEVVLERDRRERLVLLADAHALLGLDRLVQALRPAAAVEDAAGELVDDLDLAVDHRVVDVALVQRLGLQRLQQVVDQRAVLGLVEVVDAEELLGLGDAALGDRDVLVLLVELVVVVGHEVLLGLRVHAVGLLARLHQRRELGELLVEVGGLLGGAGDDQRRPRLVDEDVVDLVDDREVVRGERLAVLVEAAAVLDLLVQRRGHVVAQVVESVLGVRAVRDVGRVGRPLLLVGLHVLQHADGEAERLVDRAHPVGVAAGQVVVDGDHVDALAGERVEHHGGAWRSASCPRRSSSRRSRRRAAPCRRSSGRRSGACSSCAG